MMLLVLMMSLSGCASQSSPEVSDTSHESSSGARLASSMKDYAQQLLESHTSQMGPEQKAVVERVVQGDELSNSDYEAAWNRYAQCMVSKGYEKPVWYTFPNGIRDDQGQEAPADAQTGTQIQKWLDDKRGCSERNLDVIQDLYVAQTDNPNLYADHDEGALDCLKRKKLIAGSVTVGQYRKDMEKWEKARAEGGKAKISFDMDDVNVMACLAANGTRFDMG
ncbi:hypothetical protein [Bifidobacterium leontopitheci]|nr:hypothetical protein [Bifidobacterium leontopitheci]